jgi:hypothetical protein
MSKPKKPKGVALDLSALADQAADACLARMLDYHLATEDETHWNLPGLESIVGTIGTLSGQLLKRCGRTEAFFEALEKIEERLPNLEFKEAFDDVEGLILDDLHATATAAYALGIAMGRRLARLEGGTR